MSRLRYDRLQVWASDLTGLRRRDSDSTRVHAGHDWGTHDSDTLCGALPGRTETVDGDVNCQACLRALVARDLAVPLDDDPDND